MNSIHRIPFLQRWASLFSCIGLIVLCGCATPVGVTELGDKAAYRQITKSALNSRRYSSFTASVLHRHNLEDAFDDAPAPCIRQLHDIAEKDDRRDTLFALSELCYLRARKAPPWKKRIGELTQADYYLACAVYAYLYLFSETGEPPSPYDRRFRLACDFYNRSLAPALIDPNGQLRRKDGLQDLPAGSIRLDVPEVDMKQFGKFVSADRYRVYGLSVRNRSAGLGAPIIAVKRKTKERPYPAGLAATVFLRVDGGIGAMTGGQASGAVEVHSAFTRSSVSVNDVDIPLESDLSAHLAYSLDNPVLWKLGKALFLAAEKPIKSGLCTTQAHERGKILVVFVHGTMSSPIWWAEMINTLRADSKIRETYQFAFYLYDSGKPISFSAADMRDALKAYVQKADPDGKDEALQQTVLVGHSQGGLLIKLSITDTGDKLQRVYIDQDIETFDASAAEKALIRRYTHFESLPFVTRAVFIATPHRGSYLATGFARRWTRRLMRLPKDVMDTGAELAGFARKHNVPRQVMSGMQTSIDSMSPKNPVFLRLAAMPPAEHVKAHSIIAIKDDSEPPAGKDGVVAYTSAHVDYAESEIVVRSRHSCQQHPVTIEEVRRILFLHAESVRQASQ